ncbi:hypothetical protein IW492_03075 [Enterococcus sp. BWB1-3]|uniref:hypothetical protein n=1 Tax=Enterococcus sp. BWB1-3 TaxID=2787713 RepID=UPI001922B576|nr:hypothetical protein [Enterococcus sp. BWB1-3]MBL1228215.1 hypothetical protein [Enterococcus sp. BWB1-3]
MFKINFFTYLFASSFLALLLITSPVSTSASETVTPAANFSTVSIPVSSDSVTVTDEAGNIVDSSEYTIYEEVSLSRALIIERSYTMYRNFSIAIFPRYYHVSFESGYLTPWSGYVYYQTYYKISTFAGTIYQAKYSGTLYSKTN